MKQMTKLTWATIALMSTMTACSNVEDEPVDPQKPGTEEPGEGHKEYSCTFETAVNNGDITEPGWLSEEIEGDRTWTGAIHGEDKYVKASAHKGEDPKFVTTLSSPLLDLDAADSKIVSFDMAQAYWKETSSLEIFVVKGKTETALTGLNLPTASSANFEWVSTGNVDLSAYDGTVRIMFKYTGLGGDSNSTTWCLDNFVFGKEVAQATTVFVSYTGATVKVGEALDCAIKASVANGEGATVITAEGVPAWATFADNGDGTASIKGTAPAEAAQVAVTVTATNNSVTEEKVVNINVTTEEPGQGGDLATANARGTFEEWTGELPQGWFKYDASPLKETEIVKTGAVAARMVGKSTFSQEDRVVLEPGTYTLSYDYYMVAATGNSARIWCTAYDAAEGKTQTESMIAITKLLQPSTYLSMDTQGEWATGTHQFEVTETTYLFIQLRSYAGADVIFDNVAIAKN